MKSLRLKVYEPLPEFRWFLTWVQEMRDGTEARIAVLMLPSWQLRYDYCFLEDRWHQLALVYHGHKGLSFEWMRA